MAKPVWIQIRMIIKKKLFQKGMEIHTSGVPPKVWTIAFSRPIWTSLPPRYS